MNRVIELSCVVISLFSYAAKPALAEEKPNRIKKLSFQQLYSTKPVKGIPQSWVDKQGLDVLRYANFIQDLGLKKITPYHVLFPHFKTRNKVSNSIPPRRLWKNIAPTLRVIDQLATDLDAEVTPFLSAYRSPKFTRIIRGRSKSQFSRNNAISFRFRDVDPKKVATLARKLRKEGMFSGGVGAYKTFTHIDTRGHNVDW